LDDHLLVEVSPRHSIRLAEEYLAIVARPREADFVVRTVARRQANGLPLMAAEIVIAGTRTRAAFPLAERYPLHFRKTYFPGRMHADPEREFELQRAASELIAVAPPIGFDGSVFRSCLVPGTPFEALSPFQGEPEDIHLRQARELALDAAAGQWKLSELAFEALRSLHHGGFVHGDAVLQNFVVCPSPLEIVPIDFESSAQKDGLSDAEWEQRVQADFDPLLTHAVFLLCALGVQPGPLASAALARMDHVLRAPERFRLAIERRSELDA
jgi:hypothetical protein